VEGGGGGGGGRAGMMAVRPCAQKQWLCCTAVCVCHWSGLVREDAAGGAPFQPPSPRDTRARATCPPSAGDPRGPPGVTARPPPAGAPTPCNPGPRQPGGGGGGARLGGWVGERAGGWVGGWVGVSAAARRPSSPAACGTHSVWHLARDRGVPCKRPERRCPPPRCRWWRSCSFTRRSWCATPCSHRHTLPATTPPLDRLGCCGVRTAGTSPLPRFSFSRPPRSSSAPFFFYTFSYACPLWCSAERSGVGCSSLSLSPF